jgi:restriction system protein
MAEISVRRRGELVRRVFSVLLDQPDGLPAKEVLARLESVVPPTPFEASEYPKHPGVRRYEKIVRFSTIKAVKAGWLLKDKGRWSLSDAGREAFKCYKDPQEFEREAVRLYHQWAGSQPPSDEEEGSGEDTTAVATLEEAEQAAWKEIEEYLTNLAPLDFQNLVAAILRGMGYHVAWVAPAGPDGGMDIVAFSDPLGTQRPRIKVQVKRRQEKVSVEGLRSFLTVLGDDETGLFVSTSGFIREAETEARQQQKRRVTLVDLERLFDLWVQHYDKISGGRAAAAAAEARILPCPQ